MTRWSCIEDRVDNGTKYGRIIRKIIQGDIFADKTAVFSSNPIPPNALRHLNTGDKVAFYETNQIREGSFLCALDNLDPAIILEDVLNNEEDLKFFCRNNNLKMSNIIVMVVEAFKFFTNMKMKNTESVAHHSNPKFPPAQDLYNDRKSNGAKPQSGSKPMSNLKRSSHVVSNETELLPKVQKIATALEIKPIAVRDINSEVVQFTYDDKEECSVTSSNTSEKQTVDLDDETVEEISIDEIPNLTGNESGLIKIETDQFEQLPDEFERNLGTEIAQLPDSMTTISNGNSHMFQDHVHHPDMMVTHLQSGKNFGRDIRDSLNRSVTPRNALTIEQKLEIKKYLVQNPSEKSDTRVAKIYSQRFNQPVHRF